MLMRDLVGSEAHRFNIWDLRGMLATKEESGGKPRLL